jgi:mannobiose 2-epimerase
MNIKEKLYWLKNFASEQLNKDILPFWRNNITDEKNGGFFGEIGFDGNIVENAPKGLIMNARILFTFSSVYELSSNPADLKIANRAFQYLCDFFFDKEFGGYFWTLKHDGQPNETKKQVYALAFAIYGMSEYYKISHDQDALKRAIDLFNIIEEKSFDGKENGYFEAFAKDWGEIADLRLSAKDMNEKKTMNTHLHILEAYTNLYRVWKNDDLLRKTENLIGIFLNKILSSDDYHLLLFFDEKWNAKSSAISFGHDIEAGWLLHEAALVSGNPVLIRKVETILPLITNSALEGMSPEGGLYHESDRVSLQVEKEFEWWPQAEAMVGLMNTYQQTGEEKYIDYAIKTGKFINEKFVDPKNGEWFFRVDENLNPIKSYCKAGLWKCPYHNGRACIELIKRIGNTYQ